MFYLCVIKDIFFLTKIPLNLFLGKLQLKHLISFNRIPTLVVKALLEVEKGILITVCLLYGTFVSRAHNRHVNVIFMRAE